jgi:glycerophosphoryl diester phosphodiesterase
MHSRARLEFRIVHSVGSRRQLSALLRRSRAEPIDGVSIHERLLDAETAVALRRHAQLVMSWPVNTVERARELASWGVQGLITDIPRRIQPLAAA